MQDLSQYKEMLYITLGKRNERVTKREKRKTKVSDKQNLKHVSVS